MGEFAEVVANDGKSGEKEVTLEAKESFPSLVRLHDLKRSTHPELLEVSALQQGNVATIYGTTSREARLLLDACGSCYASKFNYT